MMGTMAPIIENTTMGDFMIEEIDTDYPVQGKPIVSMGGIAVKPREELTETVGMRVAVPQQIKKRANRK